MEKDIVKKLNDKIGLGGGFTLDGKCRPYFICHNKPGIKIELVSKDDNYKSVHIPRAQTIDIAKEIIRDRVKKAVSEVKTEKTVRAPSKINDQIIKSGDRVKLTYDDTKAGIVLEDLTHFG
jgi:hypothetical protein